jgi:hypothetical protein
MLSQLKSFYYFYETDIVNISTVSQDTGNDTKMNDTITEID